MPSAARCYKLGRALGRAIGQNHEVVFVVVGVFLLLLGAYILTGKRWSLPMPMMSGSRRAFSRSVTAKIT